AVGVALEEMILGEVSVRRERVVTGRRFREVARHYVQRAVGPEPHGMWTMLAASVELLEERHFVEHVVAVGVADLVRAAPRGGAAVDDDVERVVRAEQAL